MAVNAFRSSLVLLKAKIDLLVTSNAACHEHNSPVVRRRQL
jgi:hypothetical protein